MLQDMMPYGFGEFAEKELSGLASHKLPKAPSLIGQALSKLKKSKPAQIVGGHFTRHPNQKLIATVAGSDLVVGLGGGALANTVMQKRHDKKEKEHHHFFQREDYIWHPIRRIKSIANTLKDAQQGVQALATVGKVSRHVTPRRLAAASVIGAGTVLSPSIVLGVKHHNLKKRVNRLETAMHTRTKMGRGRGTVHGGYKRLGPNKKAYSIPSNTTEFFNHPLVQQAIEEYGMMNMPTKAVGALWKAGKKHPFFRGVAAGIAAPTLIGATHKALTGTRRKDQAAQERFGVA